MSSDITPEIAERVKAEVLTMQTLDDLWVLATDYADLLDRAEKAEAERDALQGQLNDLRNGWAKSVKAHAALLAERDAAFAAGQEEMRERSAAVCDKWSSTISPETDGSTGAGLCETDIRALPIKPRP